MPTRSHALVACHKQFGMLSALPSSVSHRVRAPAWLAKMVESIRLISSALPRAMLMMGLTGCLTASA